MTVVIFTGAVSAKEAAIPKDNPFIIIADDMAYNDQTNIVTAKGHVYVSHDDQLLYADRLQYNKSTDILNAIGNVWLRDKQGNFSFADSIELKNKFDEGFVHNAKMLMVDNSRLAATNSQRFQGQKVVLWNGVYSPCEICKTDPQSLPLWQLRGSKVIHDKQKKEIIYHNAFMDFWGVPVFYTPYFSHPDPTVKRKTGLLAPVFAQSKDLGFIFSQPIFFDISQNSDLTLYPIYTRKEGPLIGGEYRHLFSAASLRINTSFAGDSHNNNAQANNPNSYKIPGKHRWHAFLDTRLELNPDVLLTAKIRRASDLTYLKRYPIPIGSTSPLEIQTALTSTIALEQFKDTSYGVIRGYIFQADDQQFTPYIYPMANYNYETMPGDLGETYGANINFLNLSREKSIPGMFAKKESRISIDLNTQIPYVSPWGDIWQVKGSIRNDAYSISQFQQPISGQPIPKFSAPQDEFRQRFFPQASINWRYPFIQFFDYTQWVVEPAAMLVVGSQKGNSVNIPNEDSPFVTLDSTNIFLRNRFSGLDRLDTGKWGVYGLHSRHYWSKQRHIFLFLGQTKRLDNKTALLTSSGEDNRGSGIVGKIDFKPLDLIQFQSRFILARKGLKPDVAESNITVNLHYATVSAAHVYFNKNFSTVRDFINSQPSTKISQFNWGLTTAAYKNVTLGYSEVRNLSVPSGQEQLLSRGLNLSHANECLITTLSIARSGYQDRDLRPNTIIMLQLTFKNLGMITPININGIQNQ